MPSRILRESIVTSESVASMPADCQDRLPRYFLLTDDFGCFLVQPAVIRGRIYPLRPDITEATVARDLEEFAKAGVLTLYSADGKRYGYWPGWAVHQRPPRATARRKYPEPPVSGASRLRPAEPGSEQPYEPDAPEPGSAGQIRPQSSSLSSSSTSLAQDPPIAPREAGGHTLKPLRLRKRNRTVTTLAEDVRADQDRIRNERSKLLHEQLRRGGMDMGHDAQLEWVQQRCHASPEEAADIVAIVENALHKNGAHA